MVDLLQVGLNWWNDRMADIAGILTQSPETFRGGGIWRIVLNVHDAILAIGLGLLVLFFLMGLVKTCGSVAELKRPEVALKVFVRFAIAKIVVTHGLELMMSLFKIGQGLITTIINTAGGLNTAGATVPQSIIDAAEQQGLIEGVLTGAVALLGGLAFIVISLILILSVYGRFFKLYIYTAISPIPLSTFAGEPTSNVGVTFLKSYAGICLQGAVIVLACVIYSQFAASPPVISTDAGASAQILMYIGETVFSMMILLGLVKGADMLVKDMMGL